MTRKILSFLLAVCILITPLAYGISYTEEYTTTTPMQSEAATAGSSLNYQVFRQTDQNYGNYDPSGGAGCTIQKNGCGIMSIVNAVYHLNGNIISLKDLFTWAYSTGGYGTAGTTRYTIYPALQAAFGAKYGFSVGTMAYGKVSDATFTNHIKNGGTAIVHVYNHFMCIAGYDAASGRYLLIDPAPNWDNRHSSAGGNWMTAAGVVCRASAGASETIAMYQCEGVDAAQIFKSKNYSVICSDIKNSVSAYETELKYPLFLIVGGEKRGISSELLGVCDKIVRLDYGREFKAALSAASAASILAFEIARQNGFNK